MRLLEEKGPLNDFGKRVPSGEKNDCSKISNDVILLLWQLRWHWNPDHNKFSYLCTTAVVVIFPDFLLSGDLWSSGDLTHVSVCYTNRVMDQPLTNAISFRENMRAGWTLALVSQSSIWTATLLYVVHVCDYYKDSFYPRTQWNNLPPEITITGFSCLRICRNTL